MTAPQVSMAHIYFTYLHKVLIVEPRSIGKGPITRICKYVHVHYYIHL